MAGSGQSNMEMPIKGFKSEGPVDSAGEEIPNAKFPEIRMFTVGRKIAFALKKSFWEMEGLFPRNSWRLLCSWLFFSKKLHLELNVPLESFTRVGVALLLKHGLKVISLKRLMVTIFLDFILMKL